MADLAFVALAAGFFAAGVAFVRACGLVVGRRLPVDMGERDQ